MTRLAAAMSLLLASCMTGPMPIQPGSYYLGMPSTDAIQPHPGLTPTPSGAGAKQQYSGSGDGGLLTVRMTGMPGGRTHVEMETQGNGTACAGSFDGVGVSHGNRTVVRDAKKPTCQITFTRSGRRLSVDDGGSSACYSLHGAQCVFNGQLTQR